MKILLLADIHGNYPALKAIDNYFSDTRFDYIVNCGDSVVYAPFPNETLSWLKRKKTLSILGNTDKKVIKLLRGKSIKKPNNPEKRVMYTATVEALTKASGAYLKGLKKSASLSLLQGESLETPLRQQLGIFHGSPDKPHGFLFATTDKERFAALADQFPYAVIVTGHSHNPYHRKVGETHFINPGSVGRMFDGNPDASCATLSCNADGMRICHFRIAYDIDAVIERLVQSDLPDIYQTMYKMGKKLN